MKHRDLWFGFTLGVILTAGVGAIYMIDVRREHAAEQTQIPDWAPASLRADECIDGALLAHVVVNICMDSQWQRLSVPAHVERDTECPMLRGMER